MRTKCGIFGCLHDTSEGSTFCVQHKLEQLKNSITKFKKIRLDNSRKSKVK